MLKRKVDTFLLNWKKKANRKPLIIRGARQIGKTTSIESFGKTYKSFVEINFILYPKYKDIFASVQDVESIIREISLINPGFSFIPNDTLILFDEIQSCPNAATSLKAFAIDGRYDVICSGSLLGISYNQIESIPVGYKEDYLMYSLDFEEFMWAKGYSENQISDIYSYLLNLKQLPETYINVLDNLFKEFIFVGGMPEVVQEFVSSNTYSNVFDIQKRIYRDYEDDIIKYVSGLDAAKVKNVYKHISSQLAKDNHKFQITKLGHGARAREYEGTQQWLYDAGIINIAYNLNDLAVPLSDNEQIDYYRLYFSDHSLYIASLDDESKKDLILNNNYEINNGALYESLVSEALVKSGYDLYFYKNEDSTIELDFIIRSKNDLIPIEVKKSNGRSKSLNAVINDKSNSIKYGVKLVRGNIGFNDNKFTIPYFLTFMLKRFMDENNKITW